MTSMHNPKEIETSLLLPNTPYHTDHERNDDDYSAQFTAQYRTLVIYVDKNPKTELDGQVT